MGRRLKLMWTLVAIVASFTGVAMAQDDTPKITEGWIHAPSDGETSTTAFATVRNPGMYDVYIVSASSSAATKVELHQGADGTTNELTVPAYGKLTMKPDGPHLVLVDLEQPLKEGETIPITLTTDSNAKLKVNATVRAEQ